uniref:Uncharacterized protein n=1 Tax=Desertifilum tharense IPPAS B-1220 TaxID=1781255 RepID=A0ACD5GRK2_9CYAN
MVKNRNLLAPLELSIPLPVQTRLKLFYRSLEQSPYDSPIVKRYFIALSQYWFAIPIGMLLGGTGGFVFSEMPVAPPNYRIDGVLQYTRPPVSFSQTGTAIQTQGQSLTKDLLLAPNVVQAVANRPEVQEDVRTIRTKANVRLPNRENRRRGDPEPELFATVQYQTGDPNQGLVIVDALMQEMVEQSRLLNTARLRSIIDEINKRLPEVTVRTASSRTAVTAVYPRRANGNFSHPNRTTPGGDYRHPKPATPNSPRH